MAQGYILYNTHAGKVDVKEAVQALKAKTDASISLIDITQITNYEVFLGSLDEDDFLIIAGGDGTLNRFVNDTDKLKFLGEILYYPIGTGNDFARDLDRHGATEPFSVTEYLRCLPYVLVNGKKYRFINGVGYGIDGYCCEIGDKLRAKGKKDISYTAIAIRGLLFDYKPRAATVTVDGEKYTYKKVWLAPTMNGRFYGGGMIPAPAQNRKKGTVSTMLFHGCGKLRTLMLFPLIFKGEHVKHTKNVAVFEGNEITVEFNRPAPLQIDGETILGVTSYTVTTAIPAKKPLTV